MIGYLLTLETQSEVRRAAWRPLGPASRGMHRLSRWVELLLPIEPAEDRGEAAAHTSDGSGAGLNDEVRRAAYDSACRCGGPDQVMFFANDS